MSGYNRGLIDWGVSYDDEGYKDYTAVWLVECNDIEDGPATIRNTPGLPAIGSYWTFGNDFDPWAFCRPGWEIKAVTNHEPNSLWEVTQIFSNRPLKRCQDSQIDNPLSEPYRIHGGFSKFTEEKLFDRNGDRIQASSFEMLRGSVREFDANRPNFVIGMNTLMFPPDQFRDYIDTVNDVPMWGYDRRCVKLSNAPWARLLYGTCSFYYAVDFEFEANRDSWDRRALDESGWVLPAPIDENAIDPTTSQAFYLNPKRYVQYRDEVGGYKTAFLNGKGKPVDDINDAAEINIEYYPESNFYSLGVPGSLT